MRIGLLILIFLRLMASRPGLARKDVKSNSCERSVQGQALGHDKVLQGGVSLSGQHLEQST